MAAPTWDDLKTKLSYRLNDPSHGEWTDTELGQFVNSGHRRTAFAGECNIRSVNVTLAASTHTYDLSPLAKIIAVRVGNPLRRHPAGAMAIINDDWDNDEADVPDAWVPLSGSAIRIHPTPSTAGRGIVETVNQTPTAGGTGYVVGAVVEISPAGDADAENCWLEIKTISAGGVVTQADIQATTQGCHARGKGYAVGSGQATTNVTGTGTGMTVEITAVSGIRAYGVADVDDLGSGMVQTLAAAPTAGGTGYTVSDVLAITTGGTGATARVTAVTAGVVTAVELIARGTGYTVATGKATAGGTGSACTLSITAIQDGSVMPITDIPVLYAEEAILLAAEEEARRARPTMARAGVLAEGLKKDWLQVCAAIKGAFG